MTAIELAERHNLSKQRTMWYLGRLADYGKIARRKFPPYLTVYRVNRVDVSIRKHLDQRRQRERELMDAYLLGQISTSELADALT